MATPHRPRTLLLRHAAAKLGLGAHEVMALARYGEITVERIGPEWRVALDEVERFLRPRVPSWSIHEGELQET